MPEPTEQPQPSLSALETEYAAFLGRDFCECFAQMRHYDAQIVDICKFAFGAYTTAVGAALALYSYGIDRKIDYHSASSSIVGIALLLGLVMLSLIIRNRVYFVVVTRYINEHRAFFLGKKPLGFTNSTRMYSRTDQPPYFDWRSSQSFQLYTLSFLNSILATILALFAQDRQNISGLMIASGAILFAVQILWAVVYLKTREGKGASRVAFGAP